MGGASMYASPVVWCRVRQRPSSAQPGAVQCSATNNQSRIIMTTINDRWHMVVGSAMSRLQPCQLVCIRHGDADFGSTLILFLFSLFSLLSAPLVPEFKWSEDNAAGGDWRSERGGYDATDRHACSDSLLLSLPFLLSLSLLGLRTMRISI